MQGRFAFNIRQVNESIIVMLIGFAKSIAIEACTFYIQVECVKNEHLRSKHIEFALFKGATCDEQTENVYQMNYQQQKQG